MEFIDLSHPIESGMITYPGLPAPQVSDYLTRAASAERYGGLAEFQIGRIDMVANTGTYVDAPSHRFAGGADLAGLALERLANVPGVVVELPSGSRRADVGLFSDVPIAGCAVLIRTGWSRHWRSDRYGAADHPYLSADAAAFLVSAGAMLVGIDSVNIDDMADFSRPSHTTLLGAGVPVVEHLAQLDQLDGRPFVFFAVPPRVQGMGTFPVRAFAIVSTRV